MTSQTNGTFTVPLELGNTVFHATVRWLDGPSDPSGARGAPAWVALFFALGGGLVAFMAGALIHPHIPKKIVAYIAVLVYIILTASVDLTVSSQKAEFGKTDFKFNPACVVFVTEAAKLVISFILYVVHCISTKESFLPRDMTMKDPMLLLLPAVIFTAGNVLVFKAISKNDLSMFGVFRETTILWTAAMWKLVFRTDLGNIRMTGIGVMLCGLILNQSAETVQVGKWSWSFAWVLLMTLCNASGLVAFEYALKNNNNSNINLQSCVLYIYCMLLTLVLIAVTDYQKLTSVPEFLQGFCGRTWVTVGLLAMAGLLSSRILKLTDSMTKTVASCLRGPVVTLIAPSFVTAHRTFSSVFSALVVASGAFAYLKQGPILATTKAASQQT